MRLNHITIQTETFEKEIEFYQKYVGLTVSRDLRPLGKNIVFLSGTTDDTALEIIEKPGATDSGNENISIGFQTDDLEKMHNEFCSDGLNPTPFISPIPQVQFFFVKDPAGVNVQFI